ncbi:MAG: 7-cyano-7-deazaguanine synthase QueC [Gammaproteobacteria bacterium]
MATSKRLGKAVVLLSGGLDSATVLAMAQAAGYDCHALSFNYGQRHNAELAAAARIAKQFDVSEHRVIDIDLRQFGGSALTDDQLDVPENSIIGTGIPITYVPARNTIFLSFAIGYAEVLEAQHVFIGVNAVDYSGYPDCRPEFITTFEQLANLATQRAVEGKKLTLHAPLIDLTKAGIIRRGHALGVDYSETVSCYQATDAGRACGKCDACRLRRDGFATAGIADPTRYE